MKRFGDYIATFDSHTTQKHTYDELERLSLTKKKSKDWLWLEEVCNYKDINYSINQKLRDKIFLNYRLYNSRGVQQSYSASSIDSRILQEEGFSNSNEQIKHFDILIPILKSMLGQQQLTSLKPMAIDSSSKNVNIKKKKRLELRKQWLQETIINPIKDEAYQQWMLENNIQDQYQLSPEQQQEMSQQVGERVKILTPKDIEHFMSNEYKSPSEMQLQQITDFIMNRDKVKYWTDENFKHMMIAGAQVYDTYIRNNKANFKLINYPNFYAEGADSAHFVDDYDWGKYTEETSIPEIFSFHGSILTEADIKKLEDIYMTGASNSRLGINEMTDPMATRLATIDMQTGLFDYAPSIGTREGQDFAKALHTKYGALYAADNKVRRTKFAIKSLRELKLVTRFDKEKNQFNEFYVGENYEKNYKHDVKVESKYFPHVYQAYKYGDEGSSRFLFVEKGPVLNQYKSMNNPWDVKLPFIGAEYSRLFNNTDNVTLLDLGKPWQDKFNLRMHKYTQALNTDIGKVMFLSETFKPKETSLEDWLMDIKYHKIGLIDTSEISGIDPQLIKDIDLSNTQEIAAIIQELEWIRNQASIAMSYNPSRLGQIIPQMQVTNNQQNIQQSSYQTQDIFTLHNEIVERLLNVHINNEKYSLKGNDYIASYILDDMSRAELELNKEMIDESEIGIVIKNSSQEFNTLSQMKQEARVMLSAGAIGWDELIKVQMANSFVELLNFAERSKEQKQKQLEEQRAHELKTLEEQNKGLMKQEQLRQSFIAQEKQLDRDLKLIGYELDSDKFRRTMDADMNKELDTLQLEKEKQEGDVIRLEKEYKEKTKLLLEEYREKIKLEKVKNVTKSNTK